MSVINETAITEIRKLMDGRASSGNSAGASGANDSRGPTMVDTPDLDKAAREGFFKPRTSNFDGEGFDVANAGTIGSIYSKVYDQNKSFETREEEFLKNSMEKNRDPQIEFLEKLKGRESSGRKGVVNKEGYMGFYQVGKDRLSDFKKESGFEFDKKEFLEDEGLQEAFAAWHIEDLDKSYKRNNIEKTGMSRDQFRAVGHLGGATGAIKYSKTRNLPIGDPNKYNPADSNGTKLSDYDQEFGDS